MDFSFSKEQEDFRKEVQQFLEKELGGRLLLTGQRSARNREFSRKVAAKGWIGITWPKEYGGKEASYIDRLILMEEFQKYGAPTGFHFLGERQVGPALLLFGSEEQKKEFLPKIKSVGISFALGFSEPEAGTDLGAIKTIAEEKEDCFVVNGQKVWTSGAHEADYLWLLAVTDPKAPKYRGCSEFILNLKAPGVTIAPLLDSVGERHQNEVFLDNVRVPKEYLVGKKNGGFYQVAHQLGYERGNIDRLTDNYPLWEALFSYVCETQYGGRPLIEIPWIRSRLIDLKIEYEVGRLFAYHIAWMLDHGMDASVDACKSKFFGVNFAKKVASTAVEILNLYGLLMPGSKWARLGGEAARNYARSPIYTIQGGTDETLLNTIARRGLGLPIE